MARKKTVNWKNRMDHIRILSETLSDYQIARIYHTKTKAIKDVKRRYGLIVANDNWTWEKQPKQTAKKLNWDFGWQNLPL